MVSYHTNRRKLQHCKSMIYFSVKYSYHCLKMNPLQLLKQDRNDSRRKLTSRKRKVHHTLIVGHLLHASFSMYEQHKLLHNHWTSILICRVKFTNQSLFQFSAHVLSHPACSLGSIVCQLGSCIAVRKAYPYHFVFYKLEVQQAGPQCWKTWNQHSRVNRYRLHLRRRYWSFIHADPGPKLKTLMIDIKQAIVIFWNWISDLDIHAHLDNSQHIRV